MLNQIHKYPILTAATVGAFISTAYPNSHWFAAGIVAATHVLAMRAISSAVNELAPGLAQNIPRPFIFIARAITHYKLLDLFSKTAWAIGPFMPRVAALYFQSRPLQILPPTLIVLGVLTRVA